jgi:hypothetical protein
VTQSNDGSGTPNGENRATGNDDILMTYMGIGSRIDGLETVAASTAYNRAEIEAALKRQGLAPIGKGDVVILHSGWQEKPLSDPDSQKLVHPAWAWKARSTSRASASSPSARTRSRSR